MFRFGEIESHEERRCSPVETNSFMTVQEVAKELNVSPSYGYKLIRKLNEELEKKGIITIPGRVNRQYFNERLYYQPATKGKEGV